MGVIDELKLAAKDIDITKVGYYDSTYEPLATIIDKALSSNEKEENAKEIFNNLDFMLTYTNLFNYNWITNELLLKQDKYVTRIIDNIDNFRYDKQVGHLLYSVLKRELNSEQLVELNTPRTFKKIFTCDLDEQYYSSVFKDLDDNEQRMFINELINSNCKLDFSQFTLSPTNLDLITDNIDYLVNVTNDLYYLKSNLKNIKDIDINEIDDYINNHPDKALESIINRCTILKAANDTIKEVVRLVIKDVLKNENVDMSTIEINGTGAFSTVIMIGDKVVKVGETRVTKNFPNIPYVIKPLLRKTLKHQDRECFIEVTERVDTFEKDAYKDDPNLIEETYELYKKVRELGLMWTDVRLDNIGRLRKDNNIYWRDNIEPSDEVLEYSGKIGNETLKKGDLVILDADHIYYEDDKNIQCPVSSLREIYEARYQKEKNSNKKKGFSNIKLLTAISINTIIILGMFITYIFMQ